MNVACEACHGPGSNHIAWVQGPPAEDAGHKGLTAWLRPNAGEWVMNPQTGIAQRSEKLVSGELDVCAGCHARRKVIAGNPVPGGKFLDSYLAALLEPQGLLFISTLNRTPAAFAVAKLGAEYLLRLLPVGTHEWQRFITPAELRRHCAAAGLRLSDIAGLSFSPLTGRFRVSRELAVNYIAMAQGG